MYKKSNAFLRISNLKKITTICPNDKLNACREVKSNYFSGKI